MPPMNLFNLNDFHVIGINSASAPIAVLEGYYIEENELKAHAKSLSQFIIKSEPSKEIGGFILSTCDRTDIFLITENDNLLEFANQFFEHSTGYSTSHQPYFYHHQGESALRHILRVASALDSRMVGETQIMGQLKDQLQIFEALELIPPTLKRMMQFIYQSSAKIRHDTGLGSGVVSLTNAALGLTKDLFGRINELNGIIIGLGESGEAIANRFEQAGMGRLALTGPARRTQRFAAMRERRFIPFHAITDSLSDCDLLISAHGGGEYLIYRNQIEQAIALRHNRPILLIDGGIPSDFDPAIAKLEEAYLYQHEDLLRLTQSGLNTRQESAIAGEILVEAAINEFLNESDQAKVTDAINSLRSHFEQVRDEVLTSRPGLDSAAATRLMMNKLLHLPIDALKKAAIPPKNEGETDNQDNHEGLESLKQALRTLFKLDIDK